MAASTRPHASTSTSPMPTTVRRGCWARSRHPCSKTSNAASSLPNSQPAMPMPAMKSSKFIAIPRVYPSLSHPLVLVLVCLLGQLAIATAQPELSLPFGVGVGKSRFMNFATGKTPRNIQVFIIKNITEDVPVGESLATFRAEDKDSPSYNLT
uniref:MSP domain-containing protein n=1 Tax=Panagrellus redivivus TaxID=6233 RepID=A0A7E4VQA2_PANRE